MTELLLDIPERVTASPAQLSPAVLQAADMLGMYRAELARVLRLQWGDIARLSAAREQLGPGSLAWQQAVLFIRFYRALFALMKGNGAAMCHWLRSEDADLRGVPLLLIVDNNMLAEVVARVERRLVSKR